MALFVCPAPAVIYKRVPGMIRFKFGVFCFNLPPLCYLISRQRNLFVFAPFFLLISCLCVESVIEAAVSLLQCLHLCSDLSLPNEAARWLVSWSDAGPLSTIQGGDTTAACPRPAHGSTL